MTTVVTFGSNGGPFRYTLFKWPTFSNSCMRYQKYAFNYNELTSVITSENKA